MPSHLPVKPAANRLSRTLSRIRSRLEDLGWFVVTAHDTEPFELVAIPSKDSEPIAEIEVKASRWLGISETSWQAEDGDREAFRRDLRHLARRYGGTACFVGRGGRLEP